MDSRVKPYLEGTFRIVQMFTDPTRYARDTINQGIAEIRENIKFYILNDINKEAAVRHDWAQDVFSNEERERWFGKTQLSARDFTWDKCEALLRPAAVKGAVFRVNGALAGSRNNELFASDRDGLSADGLSRREAIYTPRTVTVYDSKEQAIAAAKLLRIITRSSGARIVAEEISRGTKDKVWVVSDNMSLKTHNTVRMFMFALSRGESAEQRAEHQQEAQAETNKRLLDGEQWDAWEGIGTLLTLQGRPGIKMYRKLENGKDDPKDVAALSRVGKQQDPKFLNGVPHAMIASDGRSLVNADDNLDVVGHIVMGPRGNALRKGNWRAAGDLISHEVTTEYGDVLRQQSISGIVARGVEVAMGVGGHIIEKPVKAVAALTAGMLSATAIAAGTGAHKVARMGYGMYRQVEEGHYREPDSLVSSFGKRWVEKQVGSRANRPRLFKVWEYREGADAQALQVTGAQLEDIMPVDGELQSPLGVIHLVERKGAEWAQRVKIDEEAREFARFMKEGGHWPSVQDVCNGRYRFPADSYPPALQSALDTLAETFGKWVLTQEKQHHLKEAVANGEVSEGFADAINRFNLAVELVPRLPADTANVLKARVVDAVTQGMEAFVMREVSRTMTS